MVLESCSDMAISNLNSLCPIYKLYTYNKSINKKRNPSANDALSTLYTLRVKRILHHALIRRRARHSPRVRAAPTLRILRQRLIRRQRIDPLNRMLRSTHDQRRRIRRHHAGENTRIDHEQIIRAPNLRVCIHHRGPAILAPVVGAHLRGADPVVCGSRRKGDGEALDVVGGGLARRRDDPGQAGDFVKYGLEVLDGFDDGGGVVGVDEVGECADGHGERVGDHGAAARGSAAAEVLA